MLSNVHIQNFRLCRDVRLEKLGDVVALVGRNGAGKSNILHAIAQTARLATAGNGIGFPEALVAGLAMDVSLEFETHGDIYRYELVWRVAVSTKPIINERLDVRDGETWYPIIRREGGAVRIGDREQPLPIGKFSSAMPALAALLPVSDEIVPRIRSAISFLAAVRYYPLDEPASADDPYSDPIKGSSYAAWQTSYEGNGNAGDSVLMRIVHMSLKKEDDFGALKSMLGKNGLGLLDDIVVNPYKVGQEASGGALVDTIYYFVSFVPSRGETVEPITVPYDALSLGTRRVLRMLVSILFDASSVMLLEQPEDSLHQGLTKKIIGLLRQNARPSQLIFSSHSSTLLNKLNPSEILLVSMHDGFTVARPLTPQQLGAAAKFMNEEGLLYDFLETVQED